ncbi:MAG: PQQ-dependent sugar dehydrogenase [Leptospiraceae bacterium]|nr:PQQ-dependent sugar dehydrogenase [Leptospiraceae bacterium]MDW7975135.1 PQQ-dependent sugar dehydrogenase [Leptospiraceae bacterium]
MKTKFFLMGILLFLMGIISSCQWIQNQIIEIFTPEYTAQSREFAPLFEGKDTQRKKILIQLQPIISGLPQITSIAEFPLDSQFLFVTIKTGEMMVYNTKNQSYLLKKFDVLTSSEQGLLGIAFHPNFKENRLLYLHYSVEIEKKKYGRISEFVLSPSKTKKGFPYELERERVLLEVQQPYSNHNGGHLEFGPDGFLYIGLGDGGWRDDPMNHSQNPRTLLGAMLRIDVKPSKDKPYSIPFDNPFRFNPDWREEIFAIGLRNPWKYSFDPRSKRLIVADVGQDAFEEISIVEKGKNYGWRIKEGFSCYLDKQFCSRTDLVDPIYVYDHSEGQSITGGYVYMSDEIPELKFKYIFGDFVQGRIWAIELPETNEKIREDQVYSLGKWPILISTFGITSRGEVLVGDFKTGKIFRITKK